MKVGSVGVQRVDVSCETSAEFQQFAASALLRGLHDFQLHQPLTRSVMVQSHIEGDADGGYRYPVAYVNQVQRQQSWHLPDSPDPAPVNRDISVYFTRMIVGGIDFAILEDRKFKTGPAGKLPQMGPRPDHINDPSYDPKTIDLPGLELLGQRQETFLRQWSQDYSGGAEMKCVQPRRTSHRGRHRRSPLHGSHSGRPLPSARLFHG